MFLLYSVIYILFQLVYYIPGINGGTIPVQFCSKALCLCYEDIKVVDCSDKELTSLPPFPASVKEWCKSLVLRDNNFTTLVLDLDIGNWTSLRQVDLKGNNLIMCSSIWGIKQVNISVEYDNCVNDITSNLPSSTNRVKTKKPTQKRPTVTARWITGSLKSSPSSYPVKTSTGGNESIGPWAWSKTYSSATETPVGVNRVTRHYDSTSELVTKGMNYETISSQSSTDQVTNQGVNTVSMTGDDRDKATLNLPLITEDSLAMKIIVSVLVTGSVIFFIICFALTLKCRNFICRPKIPQETIPMDIMRNEPPKMQTPLDNIEEIGAEDEIVLYERGRGQHTLRRRSRTPSLEKLMS